MKIYIDSKEKYNDTRSTAFSFTIVGIIGIALLVCLWMDVLPIRYDSVNKTMVTVVMGALFAVFLFVGIKSFISLKHISETGAKEKDIETSVKEWFIEEYNDQMLVQFDDSFEDDSQELYFQRYNFIFDTIKEHHPELREELIDHISETIYGEIYNEK